MCYSYSLYSLQQIIFITQVAYEYPRILCHFLFFAEYLVGGTKKGEEEMRKVKKLRKCKLRNEKWSMSRFLVIQIVIVLMFQLKATGRFVIP